MADEERPGIHDEDGRSGSERYEPPALSIYEGDTQVAWAYDRAGEEPPDDTLGSATPSTEAPKVLGWTAPRPDYALAEPVLFAAPADPRRKVSPPKKEFEKTAEKGKTTRTRATKTKLTGHDAFGGALCTCDLVCTCNLVCACQAVATCSCVEHSAPDGTCSCVGDTCSCVNYACPCVSDSGCAIHEVL